jgi:hypothetical protein
LGQDWARAQGAYDVPVTDDRDLQAEALLGAVDEDGGILRSGSPRSMFKPPPEPVATPQPPPDEPDVP